MKKKITAILIAAISLTGCVSEKISDNPSAETETGVNSNVEIAFVTYEEPDISEPPELSVQYSDSGLAHFSRMTKGSYSWEFGGTHTESDSIGALECQKSGLITANVDLDIIEEGQPQIGLYNNGKIIGVTLYPLDGSASIQVDYTENGSLIFDSNCPEGVAAVTVKFENGTADYFFTVLHSQKKDNEPPEIRIFSGDYSYYMTKCGYTWTTKQNGQKMTVCADCPSPWQMYSSGSVKPQLFGSPGKELRAALPENSRIEAACYYTSEESRTDIEYNGETLTLPEDEISAVCSLTITMPEGSCNYIFSFQTGTEFSTPAYDPS